MLRSEPSSLFSIDQNAAFFKFWAAEVLAQAFSLSQPDADCRLQVHLDRHHIDVTGWTTAAFPTDGGTPAEALQLRIATHFGDRHPLALRPIFWQVKELPAPPPDAHRPFKTRVVCRRTDAAFAVASRPASFDDIIGRPVNAPERLTHVFARYAAATLVELNLCRRAEVCAEGNQEGASLTAVKLSGVQHGLRPHRELLGWAFSRAFLIESLSPEKLSLPFAAENDRFGDTLHFPAAPECRPIFCHSDYFQQALADPAPEPPDFNCEGNDLVDYLQHAQLDSCSLEDLINGVSVEDFYVTYRTDEGAIFELSSAGPTSAELIEHCNHAPASFMEELPLICVDEAKLRRIRSGKADASILTESERAGILNVSSP